MILNALSSKLMPLCLYDPIEVHVAHFTAFQMFINKLQTQAINTNEKDYLFQSLAIARVLLRTL